MYLLSLLPTPIENSMVDTTIVHWNTESPRKYVANVDKMYSATIPERPVANNASFSMGDLNFNNVLD